MTDFDDELESLINGEGVDEDIEEEIKEERQGFDLIDRLVNRPKRKPEVVTIYLNEELGQELGFAKDVHNELGVKVGRVREGIRGEIDEELAKPENERDEKKLKSLVARAKKLVAQIEKDSLTFTLQWVPPIVEEVIDRETRKAMKVKGNVPQERKREYMDIWLDHALRATVVSIVDNRDGSVKDKISVAEARALRHYAPKDQKPRLDGALGKLINRDVLSKEALDTADF